ncbi:hybrid sensor histidine kinase/response regulator transcription factor [Bacteroides sp. 519]|uniref:hybrid sensor histidine kinase/response regulator transcription factor n=1 Tax=Bacteroides sp. 519 TaxID=2302937 RepID=UPI0013D1BA1C|nr:hybrid sensor histidine kinase/response regulator transcription factor [Bacteroides sp. 519]NDV57214.1 hybrid sensor histidine kinase/response regulator [Bacteroides sp. 519]
MKHIYIILYLLLFPLSGYSQWNCSFTHYSSGEGLSQNSVMYILEDSKGFMWFATWDGINKFNGYNFTTYKAGGHNTVNLSNNRVDFMAEDAYGYIWLTTYDNKVYRFDTQKEIFLQVPADEKGSNTSYTGIRILPGKNIWLLTEFDGAIRVKTNPETHEVSTELYSMQSGLFPSMNIHDVKEDSSGNEWLLTDNGIGRISPDSIRPTLYFVDSQSRSRQKQSFECMFEDAQHIYFGTGKGRIWIYEKSTQSFQLMELESDSDIISICSYSDKDFVVATRDNGFFTWNIETNQTVHYKKSTHKDMPGNRIVSVYVDRMKEIWFDISDARGVTHFNPFTQTIKHEIPVIEEGGAHRSQPAFFIHEDINGYLWVHPFNGGFSLYDREQGKLLPFFNEPGKDNWRFSNKLHFVMSDKQGNLWMCTHSKGLEKVTFLPDRFHLKTPHPLNYESLSNDVRSLFQDKDERLWMGLRDGKIRVYDKNEEFLGYLTANGTFSKTGEHILGVAYHIMEDSNGRIWISTKGNGIYCLQSVGTHFNIRNFTSNPKDLYSLSDNNIYCMHEDANGRIWIATFGGGLNYMEERENGTVVFIHHQNHLKGYPIDECYRARYVTSDSQGNIWVGTTLGALTFHKDFVNPESIRFNHHVRIPAEPNSLSNNDVYWIRETKNKEVYLGTFGGGLNKLLSLNENGTATFQKYSTDNGLPSDILLAATEDQEGNIWISTENGLCKFLPSEARADSYKDENLDMHAGYNEAASADTRNGQLLFGTSNGWISFYPGSISKSSYVPPVTFSRLLIHNEEVRPGKQSILQNIINETSELTLSHKQNVISIQYAAIDNKAPEKIQYAYMLEGVDTEWSYVDKQRIVTYTNMGKGKYVFKVKSTNSDGVWMDNTHNLAITILPSFWETPLAYMLYALGIIALFFITLYILFTIYRLKHKVTIEQQVSDIKLRFFTNISHELRTPLTLIAGPVEYVLKNTPLTPEATEQLQLVERNTDRMLRLVNQILDFRKIQNKKMKLKVQRIELVAFVRNIMNNFEALADEHDIDFIFEPEKNNLYLWADADQLEKIVFNLLSNAFKFTPVGKMIKVYIHENEKTISVGVQDQGIGIAANKKDSLFVRFEHLMDKNLFNQSSSGIGLSLVKELVEMHKATIVVDSVLGEGSTFIVDFIKGREHFDDEVEYLLTDYVAGSQTDKQHPTEAGILQDVIVSADQQEDPNKGLMLLVEDNDELRSFLRTIFSETFRIAEARNGKEGIEKAINLIPDIIISDVMMPDKDGLELTRELRNNLSTSHIPIILLTAKSNLESKLEGMEYGANDYITKPFSSTYLKARVENLLLQHKKIQELYRSSLMTASPQKKKDTQPTNEMSPNDRKFIDKLVELMEANMDNGELIVDDLVGELAVSRSVFFKKLKALTGLAPIEFIKEMRVKRAAELIETGEYSISQVSYMVGINDPRYFSKCFKQKYGMTPTEYKEKNQNS